MTKHFSNPQQVLSSSDNRSREYLESKYGKMSGCGGANFNISLKGAKELVRVMEKNKLKRVWGDHLTGHFKEAEVSYIEVIGNKKTFLIVSEVTKVRK